MTEPRALDHVRPAPVTREILRDGKRWKSRTACWKIILLDLESSMVPRISEAKMESRNCRPGTSPTSKPEGSHVSYTFVQD
jgi:hypothetical protein